MAMRRLSSIVALSSNGTIGCQNALPWRLRTDMAFFRAQTLGQVVIMGRKTFDSLDRKPLKDRFNIVVTHSFGLFESTPTLKCATGIGEALAFAEAAPKAFREIYVVGGQTMYEQFSEIVDRYLITVVDKKIANGDAFFDPALIDGPEWRRTPLRVVDAKEGVDEASFTITEMERDRTPEMIDFRDRLIDRPKRARFGAPTLSRQRPAFEPAMGALL